MESRQQTPPHRPTLMNGTIPNERERLAPRTPISRLQETHLGIQRMERGPGRTREIPTVNKYLSKDSWGTTWLSQGTETSHLHCAV